MGRGSQPIAAEEIAVTTGLVEGAVCRVSVNAYERSPEARRRCIERHWTNCCICQFNFGTAYGEVAEGYIHVHHLRPLSKIGGEYVVDPVEDLRPVCPTVTRSSIGVSRRTVSRRFGRSYSGAPNKRRQATTGRVCMFAWLT